MHFHPTTRGGTRAASDHSDANRVEDPVSQGETNLLSALRCGVTTVRDGGSFDGPVLELRRRIEARELVAPRLIATGAPMTSPKGHNWWYGGEVAGVEAIRRFVRAKAEAGVSHVKVLATGGNSTPGSSPTITQFSSDELSALQDEADKVGLPTMAHLTNVEGIRRAVAAGINALEHCAMMGLDGVWEHPDELIADIVRGAFWVDPTPALHYRTVTDPLPGADPKRVEELRQRRAGRAKGHRKLVAAGHARWIIGTDGGSTNPPDLFPTACEAMVTELGLTPPAVLRAATLNAARVLGSQDSIGAIRKGMTADLVAVDGDPLQDITSLARVRKVILRGRDVDEKLLRAG